MPTYTFIKERTECGNIEGCKFIGDIFRTRDEDVADRLRKSATFGKTVKEIDEDKPNEQSESTSYETMTNDSLQKLCKERDLHPDGRREALIARLCGWDDEHK